MDISRRQFFTLAATAAAAVPAAGFLVDKRLRVGDRIAQRRAAREWPFEVAPIARPAERIVVSSRATSALDYGLTPDHLAAILQTYVSDYLAPAWGVSATVTAAAKPDPAAWNILLVDNFDSDADLAGAIAYHDIDGPAPSTHLPYAPVSVQASMAYPGSVTWTASHEVGEMLVNPGINLWADSQIWTGQPVTTAPLMALEIADPVQDSSFLIDGFKVSNFVFPAYFETWREPSQLDFLNTLQYRTISSGGYQILRNGKKSWNQTDFASPQLPCWRARRILAPHVGAAPSP